MNAIIEYLEIPNTEDVEDVPEDEQNTMSTCVIDAMIVVQSINMKGRKIATCKDFAKEFVQRCRMLASGSQTVRLVLTLIVKNL